MKMTIEISYTEFIELQKKRMKLIKKLKEFINNEEEWEDEIENDYFETERLLQEDAAADSNSKTVDSSLSLVTIPLIIVIFYGAMAFMTLLAMFFINLFSNMSSERFGKLGWCLGCCGIYVRNFAFIVRLLSYLILLLIGV